MIHGVYFHQERDTIMPRYINKYIQTDVYIAGQKTSLNPLPSVASLIDPLSSTISILRNIMRAVGLAVMSGTMRISTANTALIFHDKRLLATCESGPPMECSAPELETIDWHTFADPDTNVKLSRLAGSSSEWITGHPHLDPINGDLVMFGYDIFQVFNPYIRFSVIAADGRHKTFQQRVYLRSKTPKMMHDFAITQTHAVILDLPLTMSPFNIVSGGGKPMLYFDSQLTSKFGIIPRSYNHDKDQDRVIWFEGESCMIFHTVNAWDEADISGTVIAVCLVACRFKGAKLVYAAGGLDVPSSPNDPDANKEDVVHLYYYRFDLVTGKISHAYPLSDFPMEYPSINTKFTGLRNRFAYGASMKSGSFDTALSGAQVDVLVKCDLQNLIKEPAIGVDTMTSRTPPSQKHVSSIVMPAGYYASELTFVQRNGAEKITVSEEDDGFVLVHVYNESSEKHPSELWIISAKTFSLPPLARIYLPQRVPYGLHGLWVSRDQVLDQKSATFNENTMEVVYHKIRRRKTSFPVDIKLILVVAFVLFLAIFVTTRL